MRKSRFTEEQIIQAIKRVDAGMSAAAVARELGVTSTQSIAGREVRRARDRRRIYREEGLMVRKRKRKRAAQARDRRLDPPMRPNQRWAMDFVADVIAGGRRIRALAVVYAYTRESLAIEVDT